MKPGEPMPEGGLPLGTVIVHRLVGSVGQVLRYHPPHTYKRPGAGEDELPISEWCVELRPDAEGRAGDVLLWRPENISPVTPSELVLLGGAAAGAEALFRGMFARAKAQKVPFERAVELVGIAMRAQLAGIERVLGGATAESQGAAYDADAPAEPGKSTPP